MDVLVDRCAGLDVHKGTVMAAIRTPGEGAERREVVREFQTFTDGLVALRDWLRSEGVSHVAMEATGVYWKPVWYVLEGLPGVELLLVNARHSKNLPGRKTDVADAMWIAQLLECGLLRGSFVPPREVAQLRDLTRYRTKIVGERVREIQRIQKLLEDAGIKLDSVASDVMGKSCREMLEALIAGERDPLVLADKARTNLRRKIPDLRRALVGRFDGHHALLLRMHLDHVDQLMAMEQRLDQEVDRLMAPFAEEATRLTSIPGSGNGWLRWSSPRSESTWAASRPLTISLPGRACAPATMSRPANGAPGEHGKATPPCAPSSWRQPGRPLTPRTATSEPSTAGSDAASERDPRPRRFAVAHSMIIIIWHVLSTSRAYQDLGSDYFEKRTQTAARQRYLVRELEKLGHIVTLQPAA